MDKIKRYAPYLVDILIIIGFIVGIQNGVGSFIPKFLQPYWFFLILIIIFLYSFLFFLLIITNNKKRKQISSFVTQIKSMPAAGSIKFAICTALIIYGLFQTTIYLLTIISEANIQHSGINEEILGTFFGLIICLSVLFFSFIITYILSKHTRHSLHTYEEYLRIRNSRIKKIQNKHPVVYSIIYSMSAICFPVWTLASFLWTVTPPPVGKPLSLVQNRKPFIRSMLYLLYSYILITFFENELYLYTTDTVLETNIWLRISLYFFFLYLPLRLFLLLAEKIDRRIIFNTFWAAGIFMVQLLVFYIFV